MTNTQAVAAPAKTARLLHASFVTGVLLFVLVTHFLVRPSVAGEREFPPLVVRAMLGVSLAACAAGLFLRRRIPRRSTDESANLFWTRATGPALISWAAVEGASLLSVIAYLRSGEQAALAVTGVALLVFIWLNPWNLER